MVTHIPPRGITYHARGNTYHARGNTYCTHILQDRSHLLATAPVAVVADIKHVD